MTENPVHTLLGRPAEPGLESTVTAWRLGAVSLSEVLATLAGWPVLVLAHADSARLDPLVLQSAAGTPLIAAFTSPDRAHAHLGDGLRPLWMPGSTLAAGALGGAGGAGIVLNPGSEPVCEIAAADLPPVRDGGGEPAVTAPGSRPLTALELAAVRVSSGAGTREEILTALTEAKLIVASASDPAAGAADLATSTGPGGTILLAWTHEKLIRGLDPATTWLIGLPASGLRAILPGAASVSINPGTAFEVLVSREELTRVFGAAA